MQRVWLLFFMVTLFAIALGMGAPSLVTAVDLAFMVKGANPPGIQVTATATLPSAMATAIPATTAAAGMVGEGPAMILVVALLVIAGGAVLLWRRQQSSGREM